MKPRQIIGMIIAIAIIFVLTSSSVAIPQVSADLPIGHVVMTALLGQTRHFNLTFTDNQNFSIDRGNWTDRLGSWSLNGTAGSIDSNGDGAIVDYSKTFYDFVMTIDYKANHVATNSGVGSFYWHTTNLSGFANTWNTYLLSVGAHFNQGSSSRPISLENNIDGVLSENWYYNSAYYSNSYTWPTLSGNQSATGVYNNTWMRCTISMVGNDISATWNKLDDSDVNAWRMSIEMTKYPTSVLNGFMMLRAETSTNLQIRQVLYDYPAFPISMVDGESASIHFAANYTNPVISGTPALGTLQNGYWNFTTSHANIGIFNQTFTMTNGSHVVQKHLTVSIFPDMTNHGMFYAGNPVVPAIAEDAKDPCVFYDSSVKLFKMWYTVNHPNPGLNLTLHYLVSEDGVTWENRGWPAPLATPGNQYEKVSVVKVGSIYHLLTGAFNRSGAFYYQSTDGINWVVQNGGNPIITGTLSWESGAIAAPNVLYYGGMFYVLYSAGISPDPAIGIYEQRAEGMAYGPTLTSLVKSPHPLKYSAMTAKGNYSTMMAGVRPIRYGNSWLGIGTGFDGAPVGSQAHCTLVLSTDLLNWTVYPDIAAFATGSQGWMDSMVYTGWIVVATNGAIGFWFNGVHTQEQLGMALYLPDDSYDWFGHYVNVISGDPNTFTIGYAATIVGPFVNLIFLMFAVGIVVGVIAEGTYSLRRKEMPTTQQMMKSLLNMVIYIIIGMASLGIMYSMV